ncbi:MAG TPA: thioesterase family protein, partial [Alteromonas australica]|nr:thioesterase family protein [Alteromonas australica]
MTVDSLLTLPALDAVSDNSWKVDNLIIPKNWGQGRTAFG